MAANLNRSDLQRSCKNFFEFLFKGVKIRVIIIRVLGRMGLCNIAENYVVKAFCLRPELGFNCAGARSSG